MSYLIKHLSGQRFGDRPAGTVDIPFLGAKVGEMDSWTLSRRGDIGPDAALYDLRAVFSFLSDALWDDDDYPKRVVINLRRNEQYRLEQQPGHRTARTGKSLLMEGVILCRLEPQQP